MNDRKRKEGRKEQERKNGGGRERESSEINK